MIPSIAFLGLVRFLSAEPLAGQPAYNPPKESKPKAIDFFIQSPMEQQHFNSINLFQSIQSISLCELMIDE